MPLDPHWAKLLVWVYQTNSACFVGVTKVSGLLAHESRENPRAKASFPLGYFLSFPRMLRIRVGGFQPPGQKHVVVFGVSSFPKATAEDCLFSTLRNIRF